MRNLRDIVEFITSTRLINVLNVNMLKYFECPLQNLCHISNKYLK